LYSPWEGHADFEPLYREIRKFTLVSRDRCFLLLQTLRQALHLQGDVVECGVFRGGTALLEAKIVEKYDTGKRPLHLFDSFEGMGTTTPGVDRFQAGDFSRNSADAVAQLLSPYPFVQFHVGFMPQTFEGLPLERVSWAHIDVDIYQSVRECISFLYPRLVPSGFMVFDDYGFPSCPGARRAVDEAFASLPEVPLCLPTGQCLVIKLP
jgi:O-methyltransferase